MRTIIAIFVFVFLMSHVPMASAAVLQTDVLIKGSSTAVYYFANDGKRYVFPNEGTYKSWFTNFSGIVKVTDAELSNIPLGNNVTYRPGIRMLKVQSDPKVYAVAPGANLRWVTSENIAIELYGPFWNTYIDDISDAFFVDYSIGIPIESSGEYAPVAIAHSIETINVDKGIPEGPSPRRSDTDVTSAFDIWRAYAFQSLNTIRQKEGKPPLVMNVLLNRIASIHSKDMGIHSMNLQHEGSLGETPDDRIRHGQVPNETFTALITIPHPENIGWTAENVGMITQVKSTEVESSIEKLHQAFLNEPDDVENHRTTMLSTFHPFNEVGIGIYIDSNRVLWLTEAYISPVE